MGGLATQYERIVERNAESQDTIRLRRYLSWRSEETAIQNIVRKQLQFNNASKESEKLVNIQKRIEIGTYLLHIREALQARVKFLQSAMGLRSGVVRDAAEAIQYEVKRTYDEILENWHKMRMLELTLPVVRLSYQELLEAKHTTILQVMDKALEWLNRSALIEPDEMEPVREDFDALISWYGDDSFLYGIPVPEGQDIRSINNFFEKQFHGTVTKCENCGNETSSVSRFCICCGYNSSTGMKGQ